MPNNRDIIITPEMLNSIAEIDAFNGACFILFTNNP